jgi:hypothetical protein
LDRAQVLVASARKKRQSRLSANKIRELTITSKGFHEKLRLLNIAGGTMSRWRISITVLAAFLITASASSAASAAGSPSTELRVALVIGNGTYQNVPRLNNPTKDARLMADTLQALGFTLVGGTAQLDLDWTSQRLTMQYEASADSCRERMSPCFTMQAMVCRCAEPTIWSQ